MFCCCAAEDSGKIALVDASPANEESLPFTEAGAQDEPPPAPVQVFPPPKKEDAGLAAAPAPDRPTKDRFTAKLTRDSDQAPWGLKVDFADDRTVHVCEVRFAAGAVHAYNADVPPEQQLRAGDYIMSVNGVSASTVPAATASTPTNVAEALREEMKKTSVVLEVVRPYVFPVTIDRQGESMGLELNFTNKSTSLVVVKVGTGAVARCAPEIEPGDRIVSVNGDTGTPEQLLEYIRVSSDPLNLQCTRPDDN